MALVPENVDVEGSVGDRTRNIQVVVLVPNNMGMENYSKVRKSRIRLVAVVAWAWWCVTQRGKYYFRAFSWPVGRLWIQAGTYISLLLASSLRIRRNLPRILSYSVFFGRSGPQFNVIAWTWIFPWYTEWKSAYRTNRPSSCSRGYNRFDDRNKLRSHVYATLFRKMTKKDMFSLRIVREHVFCILIQ